MGTNATQGLAILVFLAAFTTLAGAFAAGGSPLLVALFLILAGAAVMLFLKAKPWEHQGEPAETRREAGSAQREIGTARG